MVELSEKQKKFFLEWTSLTAHEKEIISELVQALKR